MSDSDSESSGPDEFYVYENRPVSVKNQISLSIYFFSTDDDDDDDDVLLLTMSQINRFTFKDLGFLMNVVPRATLTICTTHWVSYIHIVEVFVQVQKCLTLSYVSCVHLSFRRGRQPMVRHRSLHPTSSF